VARTSRWCSPRSRINDYDAIVVGAGLGGLAAAGFLARARLRVLVLERSDGAGGCVRGFESAGANLDTAISSIPRGVEDELRDGILAYLGARERCTLVPLDVAYRGLLGDVTVDSTRESYVAAFPGEGDAISKFFSTCECILEDTHRLPLQLPLEELDSIADEFPVFVRYRSATLADALDEHFADLRLQTAIALSWPWGGLPPERLSFTTFAQGLALVGRGTYAVEGSFQRLVDALVEGFREAGGDIEFGVEVAKLEVEDGRATGVVDAHGRGIAAPAVISAASPSLLKPEHLPERLRGRLRRMRPSVSAFVLFADTSHELGVPSDAFLTTSGMWASIRGRSVVIRALGWPGDPEPFDEMLDAAEGAFPGFRESSTVVGTLTPRELEARTGNADGAIYGWENTPANTGSRRLPIAGLLSGLFLAGHWSQPGHGAYRALLSGMHAARAVLAARGAPDAIPEFRSGRPHARMRGSAA
jgi:phytoene dehydrogenase-like protein